MSKHVRIGEVTFEDSHKPAKISKKSLDSDEEDYVEDENFRLRETDIDGQEGATLEYDDKIKITPFNMKEELEEDGHFDGSGNFIFKKSTDVKDNWLEDIDWVEVNRRQLTGELKNTAVSDEPDNSPLDKSHMSLLYEELLKHMKPSETVLQCIKRMGGRDASGRPSSASQRWSKKAVSMKDAPKSDPEGLLRVTELADQLLQAGDFDIYQKTYEVVSQRGEADTELDALGDALDQNADDDTQPKNGDEPLLDDVTYWHLKYSEEETVEGPYTTAQLKEFVASDKFAGAPCVLVRQTTKPNGQFYNIHRIDFDLYD